MSLKVWGWVLAILALANMIRIAFIETAAGMQVFNWIASLIVLLIAVVLLSKPEKRKAKTKSPKRRKK
jgi:uncharacterized protein (DUF58 family)